MVTFAPSLASGMFAAEMFRGMQKLPAFSALAYPLTSCWFPLTVKLSNELGLATVEMMTPAIHPLYENVLRYK